MLLNTIKKDSVFTNHEIYNLESSILDICYISPHVSDNKMYANTYCWDFYEHNARSIKKIIEPHLPSNSKVTKSHILESFYPFELHTDVKHSGNKAKSQYTILIPLDDYDSETIVFNEFNNEVNEFEDFKKTYKGKCEVRIPIDTILKLSHLHPKDLMYLSLKETFKWSKGSLFAFDRRYYHCSDNYLKSGEHSKRAILIWTDEK